MSTLDDLGKVAKILREADKIEQYQQILNTQEQLIKMQKRIAELESANAELNSQLTIAHELIHDNEVYWRMKDSTKDGPFCTRCWDVDRKLVRLMAAGGSSDSRRCPEDKGYYESS